MEIQKAVCYLRVSTQKQGASGLGVDAQRAAVERYIQQAGNIEVIEEFVEVETGKGSNALAKRPQLRAALESCRRRSATLLIAKLDRLARNVHFVSGLLETGCDFVAVDMPKANKVMIQMHAVMAEWERDEISKRTKAALSAAKARGIALGTQGLTNLKPNIDARKAEANLFAEKLRGQFDGFRLRNLTQRQMVEELNELGIRTPAGYLWKLIQVQRLIKRLATP
ncbi:recombinase family protein [Massilia sp. S19_KUP03_FR1]|uniref:recombinase family protein n=1 Tax=Massilia sp. S19_KUP03_FR1 TaxID=3025503 RepID=UPI002FCD529F